MAIPSVWSKVAVAIESAAATAVTINSITKANPGVVTYTGTDPVNGDYVKLSVVGMTELDNRVLRVANVNSGANTFELADVASIDTTLFGTFTSGTFQVLTFGTSFNVFTSVAASGGDAKDIDATTIHDDIDKIIPGNFNALSYNFDAQWDPTDAGLVAAKAASDIKAQKAMLISFSNSRRAAFLGYVGYSGAPTGQAQGVVTSPLTIKAFGRPSMFIT